jgi:hypothetical protein
MMNHRLWFKKRSGHVMGKGFADPANVMGSREALLFGVRTRVV